LQFLNLSLAQFLTTFGVIAAFSVALYLLDRTRRRQVVATLRFWVEPGEPAPVTRRRRIQQPLSLLLQLLGMALLLLALAQFQFGGRQNSRRDHVLVLDTSAWMAASLPARGDTGSNLTLMDSARANALGWLRAVPSGDRVMLIRADALATPATAWESDRKIVARAVLESTPGATALNLSQSLEFARQMQLASGSVAGEIAYIGPGRISAREANNMAMPALPSFRVINVDDRDVENVGLRSMGARRSPKTPGVWDVLIRARNYGRASKSVSVTLTYGHAPEGIRPIELPPGGEKEVSLPVRTAAAGLLEARLYPKDAFGGDNYVSLELPEMRSLHVTVYSDQPDLLRPALASDPRITAVFKPTLDYETKPDGLTILHRFRPETPVEGSALWIDPPGYKPAWPMKTRVKNPAGLQWVPDLPLTAGLRARDVQIDSTTIFLPPEKPSAKDFVVATADDGPVMVAHESADGRTRSVLIGFDPFSGGMRFELSTPLLLANTLRWVAPDVFRDVDVGAQSAGAVAMALPNENRDVQVLTDNGASLPFNVRERSVQFFAGRPERVRVITGNSERVYSLTLPELWDLKWTVPSTARRGLPSWNDAIHRTTDLWPYMAMLGAGLLVLEWVVWGRHSASRLRIVKRAARMETAA
jgi:hypothetical protein